VPTLDAICYPEEILKNDFCSVLGFLLENAHRFINLNTNVGFCAFIQEFIDDLIFAGNCLFRDKLPNKLPKDPTIFWNRKQYLDAILDGYEILDETWSILEAVNSVKDDYREEIKTLEKQALKEHFACEEPYAIAKELWKKFECKTVRIFFHAANIPLYQGHERTSDVPNFSPLIPPVYLHSGSPDERLQIFLRFCRKKMNEKRSIGFEALEGELLNFARRHNIPINPAIPAKITSENIVAVMEDFLNSPLPLLPKNIQEEIMQIAELFAPVINFRTSQSIPGLYISGKSYREYSFWDSTFFVEYGGSNNDLRLFYKKEKIPRNVEQGLLRHFWITEFKNSCIKGQVTCPSKRLHALVSEHGSGSHYRPIFECNRSCNECEFFIEGNVISKIVNS
jgi:hypothetical protein